MLVTKLKQTLQIAQLNLSSYFISTKRVKFSKRALKNSTIKVKLLFYLNKT